MVTDEDRKANRITDADIEAIPENDPVWPVAERVVYENHGAGNAAVIIRRYGDAAYERGKIEGARLMQEAAARWVQDNWPHDKRTLVPAIRALSPEDVVRGEV